MTAVTNPPESIEPLGSRVTCRAIDHRIEEQPERLVLTGTICRTEPIRSEHRFPNVVGCVVGHVELHAVTCQELELTDALHSNRQERRGTRLVWGQRAEPPRRDEFIQSRYLLTCELYCAMGLPQ